MKRAFVLMTAMPPTTGHLQLVQFAEKLCKRVTVIVCTQPFEPLVVERVAAFRQAIATHRMHGVRVENFDKVVPQDPEVPGFWGLWRSILRGYGVGQGDYIVASEPYGQKLAELTGAQFMPYDIDRTFNHAKATLVRADPLTHFMDVLPEFRQHLTTRVTVFGAESTGKTTLSRQIAAELRGLWLFEYARPYLERTVNEITIRSMTAIWQGQRALQDQAQNLTASPFIIQDTDLFSTVGYWQFPHWRQMLGDCPGALVRDAKRLSSDLYIITSSTIPFEQDPLRYGGDKREGSDAYWTEVCKRYELPYIVLESADAEERLCISLAAIRERGQMKAGRVAYDRHGY